jgi:leader peptidase (prepilin peptidase)/N-methyltransferase
VSPAVGDALALCGHAIWGLAVGGLLTRAIRRLPWQKSIFWPESLCPQCHEPLTRAEKLPMVGFVLARGRYSCCGQRRAWRDPLVELLTAVLFVAVAWAESRALPALGQPSLILRVLYHQVFVGLLVAATFIDTDYTIIPDEITLPGIFVGLVAGTLAPWVRLDPAPQEGPVAGFLAGLIGLCVGGGMIWIIRVVGSFVARREAMGFGDVTLMAMIGSFLGWHPMPAVLFLAAFLGLIPSIGRVLIKVALTVGSWFSRRKIHLPLGEIPFGPHLSAAAIFLHLFWNPIWTHWLGPYFTTIRELLGPT